LSRYTELLKQIPPGNKEPSEFLIKSLNAAAYNLITNKSGLYELSEEERRNIEELPEVMDRKQSWGLLNKWPLEVGELMQWQANSEVKERYLKVQENLKGKFVRDGLSSLPIWVLAVSFNQERYASLAVGSKEEIFAIVDGLERTREENGEEAYKEELMYLRDDYLSAYGGEY
jgi:hypothetical protein